MTITCFNKQANNNADPLVLNPNLLQAYREQCDICLVNLKRELTRSLVDYKLFQELQQINNDFYVIIDYMECGHYTKMKEVYDDQHKLVVDMEIFTKNCKTNLITSIYEEILGNCREISLIMNKLVQIIKIVNEGE